MHPLSVVLCAWNELQYIHDKGISHMDMSLENCLIDDPRSNAFIIDFGMCIQMPLDAAGQR